MKVFNGVDSLIGNTPILRLKNIEKAFSLKAKIYAKLEFLNPAGSIKDRVAKEMLDDYENRGLLTKYTVIIEPTSGNTGIGLCSIGASRGYKTIIVMPENMSDERKKLIKAYGGELVLSKSEDGMKGAIELSKEIQKSYKSAIIVGQFENPNNVNAHYKTTGPEIYNDLDGNVDIFIAGIGTGGTITGTSKYLKEQIKNVKVVGVEPLSSPLISKGVAGSHKIQGIGANFIPPILDKALIDQVNLVSDDDAYQTTQTLGKLEGILVGISSGANLYTAINLAKMEENKNKNIVIIFADNGERYLSTLNLFE